MTETGRQTPDNTENSSTDCLPLRLLKEHGVSRRMLARAAGCAKFTVEAVLDPRRCDIVSVGKTRLVRQKVQDALALFGHDIPPDELWKEHDNKKEAA